MILQSFYSYYDRLASEDKVPAFGFSREGVSFALEIDEEGNLSQELDLRENVNNKPRPISMEIPFSNQVNVRSSNIQPNFLVDKACYVLGNDQKTKPKRLAECQQQYVALLESVAEYDDSCSLKPVLQFYKSWRPELAKSRLELWKDIGSDTGGLICFKIAGKREFLHQNKNVRRAWQKFLKNKEGSFHGPCLISGDPNVLRQNLCAQFKGIAGGQSSGMSLVSVNMSSAESYGKKETSNCPVGVQPEFKSSTALKYLIHEKSQHLYIGEAYTVFWTERASSIEGMFGMILNPAQATEGDTKQIREFLASVRSGRQPEEIDPDIKFYILGLSPNAARLSVRFWHVCSVGEMEERIGQHYRDLEIVGLGEKLQYPGIRRLLWETHSKKSKKETASPLLAGALMRSIMEGTAYPQNLLTAVLNRIRADQEINSVRAAIIKAVINRKNRIYNTGLEAKVMLDTENKTPAYLLGRLFAVLERTQQAALGQNINSTIKDRYFGSASATPSVVFPQLLRLSQHHISKTEAGGYFEKEIGGILEHVQAFPPHLTIDQQGVFTLGYYHQRQHFFKGKNKTEQTQN
ncbi:CRISPR-associated protein Cas8c/Csd1, subtype I-C/DVULG [Anaerohalosphaera lusitana]|uniref:CRISPR-associated protein Cas8c/Csd1, subtype I-C/DVULG n=1 Tax=Anaerohalosphaera lusitana TaxID=1936003 RepID=A0A1U9NL98_9BACT|nr:type I-C CRISPR-associated protein Cas8c/Csd1 [Anaerohalosphaera lusitana]AQT68713.1 CRISPR-associated protein Cas8c/Csd1, subtype I-C/DVULG [Anaerohalosphaera lusitana]